MTSLFFSTDSNTRSTRGKVNEKEENNIKKYERSEGNSYGANSARRCDGDIMSSCVREKGGMMTVMAKRIVMMIMVQKMIIMV